jgi:CRP-like cAMP-binding protein
LATILHNMNFEKYASLAFFSGLSNSDLHALAPYFTSSTYVAGTTIFNQGDVAENLFLVASGEVTIHYKPIDGPSMTVTRVQPGAVFGWSSAMGNGVYTSGAVCSLDSEILCVRGDELRYLCNRNVRIGSVLLNRLSLVVADRQRSHQVLVSSMLADGMRNGSNSGGNGNG